MVLASIGFGEILWGFVVFFFMVIYFMMLFNVIADLFRDHEMKGITKALWVIALLFFPLFSVLIYLIVHSDGMARRQIESAKKADTAMREYVAQTGGTATQLKEAKELLDAGTIDQADYEKLKAKILN